MRFPEDMHESTEYWQEYACPACQLDFDVSPIPRAGESVGCGCGEQWAAPEHALNTYLKGELGDIAWIGGGLLP